MRVLIFTCLLFITSMAQTDIMQKVITVDNKTLCAEISVPKKMDACTVQLAYELGFSALACGYDYKDYYEVCGDSMFTSTRKSLQEAILNLKNMATGASDVCGEKTITLRGTQETCPVYSEILTLEGNGCQLYLANVNDPESSDCVTTRGFGGSYPIDKDTEYNCKITMHNETVPDIETWRSDWQRDVMTYTPKGGNTSSISQLNFVSKLSPGDVLEWKVPARSQGSRYDGWEICFKRKDFKPTTCKSWCGSQSHYLNPDLRITFDQYCAPENAFCSTCDNLSDCRYRACPDCKNKSYLRDSPSDLDSSSQSLSISFFALTLIGSLLY